MPQDSSHPKDAAEIAQELAAAIEAQACEYAIGGAIALGFWSEPRGTLAVDVTLFIPPSEPSRCVRLLQSIGCEFVADEAIRSFSEHGYCQVDFHGGQIDVFLPIAPFYEHARERRRKVALGEQSIMIWDPETLCVFKLMFFRRKDLADVEQLLRVQQGNLDTEWVSQRILEMYGQHDPRLAQWEELVSGTKQDP